MASRHCHYDAAFKRKVIARAEVTGNCMAGRKLGVPENNVHRSHKQKTLLLACAVTRKAFCDPQKRPFSEVEEVLTDFVKERRGRGLAITGNIVQTTAHKTAKECGIPALKFKASRGWLQEYTKRARFSLQRWTSVMQKLPGDYEEKLISFQRYVIDLQQSHDFLSGKLATLTKLMFFDMPSAQTIRQKR